MWYYGHIIPPTVSPSMVDDSFRKMVTNLQQQQADGVARRQQIIAQQAEDKARAKLGLPPIPRPKPEWAKPKRPTLEHIPSKGTERLPYKPEGKGISLEQAINEYRLKHGSASEPYLPEAKLMKAQMLEGLAKYERERPIREAAEAKAKEAKAKDLHNKRMAKYRKAKRILPIKPSKNYDDV